MKLLEEFDNLEVAEVVRTQLFHAGIVSHLSVDGSSTIGGILPDRHFVSLFIVFDNQYEDAVNYLKNKHHIVTTGLSKEEIKKVQKSLKVGINTSINKALIPVAIIMAALFVFLVTR